jgi:hypothetical protein
LYQTEAREAAEKAKAAGNASTLAKPEEKKAVKMSSLQRQLFDRLVQAAREAKDPMVERMLRYFL